MFIGSPVMPDALFNDGIETTLDAMRELSGINCVMTYSNNYASRQYRPNFAPPIDGVSGHEVTDLYVRTHEKYYTDTPLRQQRNPDALWSDRDLIDELCEAAKPRGMDVYARILEPYVITGAIPGLEACAEIDANGEPGKNACFNHPDYMAFWEAVVTDLVESHPEMAGFKFGQERGGPFLTALGGTPATCFCEYCTKLAKQRGLDPSAAREGMLALQKYGADHRQPLAETSDDRRPRDGYMVTLLRLFSRHPGLLAWERFWMDSRENQRRRMYAVMKKIRPTLQVGWHIDHGMSWDLITRATWDYADMVAHSDWLSIGLYFDCMGHRSFSHFRKNYESVIFADARPETAYHMYLSALGFDPEVEPKYASQLEEALSFSAEYVYAESRRAIAGVKAAKGKTKIYSRIGFNVPLKPTVEVSEEEAYQATTRALQAGADGLWVGREWDELKPANAAALGRAARDWMSKK
ncbi:hypothetical protein [Haloferula sp.]|uniref:hypothetical protein n=1 Tax=Haloferula sp. TaxID=2497595 RepID=UPI003C735739